MAYRHFGDPRHLEYARHGLRFLRDAHWDDELQGYDWELDWRDGAKRATLDGTRHCYGPRSCCSRPRTRRWPASTRPAR